MLYNKCEKREAGKESEAEKTAQQHNHTYASTPSKGSIKKSISGQKSIFRYYVSFGFSSYFVLIIYSITL